MMVNDDTQRVIILMETFSIEEAEAELVDGLYQMLGGSFNQFVLIMRAAVALVTIIQGGWVDSVVDADPASMLE